MSEPENEEDADEQAFLDTAAKQIKARISQEGPHWKYTFVKLDLPEGTHTRLSSMIEVDGLKGRRVSAYDPIKQQISFRFDVLIVPIGFPKEQFKLEDA